MEEKLQQDVEVFQTSVSRRYQQLYDRDDFLSLSWIRELLKEYQSCQQEFKKLLNHHKGMRYYNRPVVKEMILQYLDMGFISLELFNEICGGLGYIKAWRQQLFSLSLFLNIDGKPDFDAVERVLRGLNYEIRNEKENNQTSYFPFDDVPEWSASSQLDLLRAKLSIPTPGEGRASDLLANSVFTINCVQFITLWCFVAALPCQGRRLETRFFPEGSMEEYTWYKPLGLIWNRINVENLNCSGLLREMCQIETYAREMPKMLDPDEYRQSSERRARLSQMEEEIREILRTVGNNENGLLKDLGEDLKDVPDEFHSRRVEITILVAR